jgi:lysozyme
MNRDRLEKSIKVHEGLRLEPYFCSEGKLTIGYGYNLENGIPIPVADLLFTFSLNKAMADAQHMIPTFKYLSAQRQEVLVEMVFQLGLTGVLRFKRMLQALKAKDYDQAAAEMLDSRWRRQTPSRAELLASRMVKG